MSSATLTSFNPGALVCARGREWVVQPGSSDSLLRLRPLGGSEEDERQIQKYVGYYIILE